MPDEIVTDKNVDALALLKLSETSESDQGSILLTDCPEGSIVSREGFTFPFIIIKNEPGIFLSYIQCTLGLSSSVVTDALLKSHDYDSLIANLQHLLDENERENEHIEDNIHDWSLIHDSYILTQRVTKVLRYGWNDSSVVDPIDEYIGNIQELKLSAVDGLPEENTTHKVKYLRDFPEGSVIRDEWGGYYVVVASADNRDVVHVMTAFYFILHKDLVTTDRMDLKIPIILKNTEDCSKLEQFENRVRELGNHFRTNIGLADTRGGSLRVDKVYRYGMGHSVDPVDEYIGNIQELKISTVNTEEEENDTKLAKDCPFGSIIKDVRARYFVVTGQANNSVSVINAFCFETRAEREAARIGYDRYGTGDVAARIANIIRNTQDCYDLKSLKKRVRELNNFGIKTSSLDPSSVVDKVYRHGIDQKVDPVDEYIGNIQELKLAQDIINPEIDKDIYDVKYLRDLPFGSVAKVSDDDFYVIYDPVANKGYVKTIGLFAFLTDEDRLLHTSLEQDIATALKNIEGCSTLEQLKSKLTELEDVDYDRFSLRPGDIQVNVLYRYGTSQSVNPIDEYIDNIQELKLAQTDNTGVLWLKDMPFGSVVECDGFSYNIVAIPSYMNGYARVIGAFAFETEAERRSAGGLDAEIINVLKNTEDCFDIENLKDRAEEFGLTRGPYTRKGGLTLVKRVFRYGIGQKIDPVDEYIDNIQELKLSAVNSNPYDWKTYADIPEGTLFRENLEGTSYAILLLATNVSNDISSILFSLVRPGSAESEETLNILKGVSSLDDFYANRGLFDSYRIYYESDISTSHTGEILEVYRVGWSGPVDPVEEYIGNIQELKLSAVSYTPSEWVNYSDIPEGTLFKERLDFSSYIVLKLSETAERTSMCTNIFFNTSMYPSYVKSTLKVLESITSEDDYYTKVDLPEMKHVIVESISSISDQPVGERIEVLRIGWPQTYVDPIDEYIGNIQELKLAVNSNPYGWKTYGDIPEGTLLSEKLTNTTYIILILGTNEFSNASSILFHAVRSFDDNLEKTISTLKGITCLDDYNARRGLPYFDRINYELATSTSHTGELQEVYRLGWGTVDPVDEYVGHIQDLKLASGPTSIELDKDAYGVKYFRDLPFGSIFRSAWGSCYIIAEPVNEDDYIKHASIFSFIKDIDISRFDYNKAILTALEKTKDCETLEQLTQCAEDAGRVFTTGYEEGCDVIVDLYRYGTGHSVDPVEEYIGNIQELKLAQEAEHKDIFDYPEGSIVLSMGLTYPFVILDTNGKGAHALQVAFFNSPNEAISEILKYEDKDSLLKAVDEAALRRDDSYSAASYIRDIVKSDTIADYWDVDKVIRVGWVETKIDPVEEYIGNIQELKLSSSETEITTTKDLPVGSIVTFMYLKFPFVILKKNAKGDSLLNTIMFEGTAEEVAIELQKYTNKAELLQKAKEKIEEDGRFSLDSCRHTYSYSYTFNFFGGIRRVDRVGWSYSPEIDPVDEYIDNIQELKLSSSETETVSIKDLPVGSIVTFWYLKFPFVILKKYTRGVRLLQTIMFEGTAEEVATEVQKYTSESELIQKAEEKIEEDGKYSMDTYRHTYSYPYTSSAFGGIRHVARVGWSDSPEIDPVDEYIDNIQELKLAYDLEGTTNLELDKHVYDVEYLRDCPFGSIVEFAPGCIDIVAVEADSSDTVKIMGVFLFSSVNTAGLENRLIEAIKNTEDCYTLEQLKKRSLGGSLSRIQLLPVLGSRPVIKLIRYGLGGRAYTVDDYFDSLQELKVADMSNYEQQRYTDIFRAARESLIDWHNDHERVRYIYYKNNVSDQMIKLRIKLLVDTLSSKRVNSVLLKDDNSTRLYNQLLEFWNSRYTRKEPEYQIKFEFD